MNNPSILHICSYYVGTPLYQNLFDALTKQGVTQDAYVFVDYDYRLPRERPANVIFAPCYRKYDRLFFRVKHRKVLEDAKRRLDFGRYDLLHAHSLFSNGYVAYMLKQQYNIPYVVAVRNTDVNLFFGRMVHLRKIGVDILLNASKIVFLSESYRNHTFEHYIPAKFGKEIMDKTVVIPNGIDRFWLENRFYGRKGPLPGRVNIIYAGRVDRNKNVQTTLQACDSLVKSGYKVQYTVVGGIENERYLRLLNKYPYVNYIPRCPKEELMNYYRASDIFVMPSRTETFGLVYAEALSQGLPVIYTRGQGFDGYFDEGVVGYSVDCNSPDEIVARVNDILADYNGISTRCVAYSQRFDWDKIAAEYIEVYREVLSR